MSELTDMLNEVVDLYRRNYSASLVSSTGTEALTLIRDGIRCTIQPNDPGKSIKFKKNTTTITHWMYHEDNDLPIQPDDLILTTDSRSITYKVIGNVDDGGQNHHQAVSLYKYEETE